MNKKYRDAKRILGVCIKSYQNEDDLEAFDEGKIQAHEIRTINVGDEDMIVDGFYNKEYWKPKEKK